MSRLLPLLGYGMAGVFLFASPALAEGKASPNAAAGMWAKRATGDKAPEAEPETPDAANDASDGEQPENPEATPSEDDTSNAPATSGKTGWKQRIISPIFSELVMFTMPVSFAVRFENSHQGAYIREAVPKGESVEQWSEMITVTGTKDLADAGVTPISRFEQATQLFKRACPNTFASKEIEPIDVKDHETYAAVASCGTVSGQPEPHSETTVFLIIKGAHDYYSLQWAVRGTPSSTPLGINADEWHSRLAKFVPVNVCVRKPGEQAPYPSCIGG